MNIESHTMQSRVSDIQSAIEWYERLLERRPDFMPDESIAEWQLYPGSWLVVIAARPDAGRNRIRFGVSDLSGERARVQALGISVTEPVTLPGVVRYCDFEDPDGNRLGLFQDLSRYPLEPQ